MIKQIDLKYITATKEAQPIETGSRRMAKVLRMHIC